MRARSQWTPGGIGLWLIAAVLATLIVCSELEPRGEAPPPTPGVEVEFELEGLE